VVTPDFFLFLFPPTPANLRAFALDQRLALLGLSHLPSSLSCLEGPVPHSAITSSSSFFFFREMASFLVIAVADFCPFDFQTPSFGPSRRPSRNIPFYSPPPTLCFYFPLFTLKGPPLPPDLDRVHLFRFFLPPLLVDFSQIFDPRFAVFLYLLSPFPKKTAGLVFAPPEPAPLLRSAESLLFFFHLPPFVSLFQCDASELRRAGVDPQTSIFILPPPTLPNYPPTH